MAASDGERRGTMPKGEKTENSVYLSCALRTASPAASVVIGPADVIVSPFLYVARPKGREKEIDRLRDYGMDGKSEMSSSRWPTLTAAPTAGCRCSRAAGGT